MSTIAELFIPGVEAAHAARDTGRRPRTSAVGQIVVPLVESASRLPDSLADDKNTDLAYSLLGDIILLGIRVLVGLKLAGLAVAATGPVAPITAPIAFAGGFLGGTAIESDLLIAARKTNGLVRSRFASRNPRTT